MSNLLQISGISVAELENNNIGMLTYGYVMQGCFLTIIIHYEFQVWLVVSEVFNNILKYLVTHSVD